MFKIAILSVGVAVAAIGCAHASLSDPVVARTGGADTNDGYQAALAAVRADGYAIVEGSEQSGYLSVASKSCSQHPSTRSIAISVWPGSVRLDAALSNGQLASESDVALLRREMQELAWSIAGRARALAGEVARPVSTRPYGYDVDQTLRNGPYSYPGGLQ
jgi:hypothetical protein